MSNFRNHVQLIGNVGEDPKITLLDGGRKVARFPMATNEHYTNNQGEKIQNTDWHQVVAWGKTAEDGNQRYVTEIIADEVLLMGPKAAQEDSQSKTPKSKTAKKTSTKKDA